MLAEIKVAASSAFAAWLFSFVPQSDSAPTANPNGLLSGMASLPAPDLLRIAGIEVADPNHYVVVHAEVIDGDLSVFNVTSEPTTSPDPNVCETDHVMFGARRSGSAAVILGTYQFVGYQWKPETGCRSIDVNENSKDGLSLDEFKLKNPLS